MNYNLSGLMILSYDCQSETPNIGINKVYVSNIILNNWHNNFYKDINRKLNTVNIIEYMDNDLYDKLLSENIIFLNFYFCHIFFSFYFNCFFFFHGFFLLFFF